LSQGYIPADDANGEEIVDVFCREELRFGARFTTTYKYHLQYAVGLDQHVGSSDSESNVGYHVEPTVIGGHNEGDVVEKVELGQLAHANVFYVPQVPSPFGFGELV
jgi:hypothetical protein